MELINLTSYLFQIDLPITLLTVVCLILAGLYIKEVHSRSVLEGQISKLPLLSDTQEKGYKLLHQALRKAQAIIGGAELESVKVIADSKVLNRKFEEKYQAELEQNLVDVTNNATLHLGKSQEDFTKYLEGLKTQSSEALNQNQAVIQQRTLAIFDKFEQNLTDFLTQAEKKSTASIELELKSARELIDAYKTQQLKLVDENIIAMLEKTLSLVLAKKMTLKEQMDLVYGALEKAKMEKFII